MGESIKPEKIETPFQRFKRLTTKVVAVPREEIQRREAEYKRSRRVVHKPK